MFGRNKSAEASDLAFNSLEAICRPYMQSDKLTQIIMGDPYVAGYLSARIPVACVAVAKELGVQQQDVAAIMSIVSQRLYGTEAARREMSAHADELLQAGDQQFKLGYDRAMKLLKYMNNIEDITSDSDFPKAMEVARSLGLPQSNDIGIPITGLERLWFGSYMEQYL